MKNLDMQYKEIVEHGIALLIGAFSASVEELFKKPLIISTEKNHWAELPKHIQMAIVSGAFYRGAAQAIASTAMLAGDVPAKQVFSSSQVVMRHYFDLYLKDFKGDYERAKNLGKGPGSGDDGKGNVHGGEPDPTIQTS